VPGSAITWSKQQHVAKITLNRPEASNAVNVELAREMAEACQEIGGDEDVYVAVITGAGEGAFCAGTEPEGTPGYGVAHAVASLEQPVIAAVNGDALGEGLELALSCDIRLASSRARFGLPQVTRGIIPADGGTQRLPRIVGKGKALELIFTGETLGADEALQIGLVSKVVAPEELAAEADELAESLAGKAPIALRYAKEAVTKGLDLTLGQGLRLEADLYFLLHTTDDRTEGIRAFLEKRSPRFRGE
jgi:enoyl-CoA hydratase